MSHQRCNNFVSVTSYLGLWIVNSILKLELPVEGGAAEGVASGNSGV